MVLVRVRVRGRVRVRVRVSRCGRVHSACREVGAADTTHAVRGDVGEGGAPRLA